MFTNKQYNEIYFSLRRQINTIRNEDERDYLQERLKQITSFYIESRRRVQEYQEKVDFNLNHVFATLEVLIQKDQEKQDEK